MESTKACTRCGEVKPLSAFSKHRLSKDGHAWQCKECNAKRAKIWRSTPMGIYTNIRGLQNFRKKKPVIITQEEFIEWYASQEKKCVYCDITESDLSIWVNNFNDHAKRLTVDCKNNDVGYTLDNIVLACECCNMIKTNIITYWEMLEIGQKYIRPKWEALKPKKRSDEE